MHYWYSNQVTIPGEATIPDDVAQTDVTCIHQVWGENESFHEMIQSLVNVLPPRQDTTIMKRSFPGMLLEPLQLQVLVELWADGPR